MDSTVCLLQARESGREPVSFGIDYGQPHQIESAYAANQCRMWGIERRVLRLDWERAPWNVPTGRTPTEMRSAIAPTFVPGRNAVFLTLAYSEAVAISAEEVWIGVNSVDFSGYPDCRPEFIESFRTMIDRAIPDAPKLIAPLINLTKAEIAAEAKRLGIGRDDTWSCYQPKIGAGGISPCGECDACILHDQAWGG